MRTISELVFVVGPDDDELRDVAEALSAEACDLGLEATIERTSVPEPRPGLGTVLVCPERLTIGRRRRALDREVLAGAVLLHAGLPRRSRARRLSASPPTFELDLASARARQAHGAPVDHLPLGFTERWAPPEAGERDIDIAILGAHADEQMRILAGAAGELARWRTHILIDVDRSAPAPTVPATGAERRAVLERSKVVVDLARPRGPRLDALRAVEAACAGAVLVREESRPLDPLEAGRDYVAGGREAIAAAAALLGDDDRRRELQSSARRAVETVPLRSAVEALATAAGSLPGSNHRARVDLSPPRGRDVAAPPAITKDPAAAAARRRLKRVRLAEIELARDLDRIALKLDGGEDVPRVELDSESFGDAEPRVSVLVTLFNYEHEIEGALSSMAESDFRSVEAVVVDDASTDGSRERVRRWIESHPQVPVRLVAHPTNRGLPSARNTALDYARAELAFVLDADNRVLPRGLGRLVEALDADPGAAFAYGIMARVDDRGEPLGVINVGGWEPSRLRHTNYVDAMAMLRTNAVRELGGYATQLDLFGWEDYDLWCRMAERGMRGAYVPEIVAIYRSALSGMAWSVSNISTTDAFRAVISRAPTLMAGVEPPR
jgi:GT2 family glycosyltransferase